MYAVIKLLIADWAFAESFGNLTIVSSKVSNASATLASSSAIPPNADSTALRVSGLAKPFTIPSVVES